MSDLTERAQRLLDNARQAEQIGLIREIARDLLAELGRRDRRDAFIPDAVETADAALIVTGVFDATPGDWTIEVVYGEEVSTVIRIYQIESDVSIHLWNEGDEWGWEAEAWNAETGHYGLGHNGRADSPAAAALAALDALGITRPTKGTEQ